MQVQAKDSDEGANGTVTYTLMGPSGFSIDSKTGVIRAESQLEATMYYLTVTASDSNPLPMYNRTTVEIESLEESGELSKRPVFSMPYYYFPVRETVPNRTYIGQVNSTQPGVRYRMQSILRTYPFVIDEVTGVITTSNFLDREAEDFYQFTVIAASIVDRSSYTYCQVTVNVTDVNDNTPRFLVDTYVVGKHYKPTNGQ